MPLPVCLVPQKLCETMRQSLSAFGVRSMFNAKEQTCLTTNDCNTASQFRLPSLGEAYTLQGLMRSQQIIYNICHTYTRDTRPSQITVRQKSCQPTSILEQAKLIYMLTQLVSCSIQTQSPACQQTKYN